jgi:hypothetical protein
MYRDDRQALLSRIDALERELAELRPRAASLEAENVRLRELVAKVAPAPPLGQLLRLRVRGPTFEFEREYTYSKDVIKIGRVSSADLQLQHPNISRMHSVIERAGATYNIVDMGSTEGMSVNGTKVNKAAIQSGDVIEIGPFTITVL